MGESENEKERDGRERVRAIVNAATLRKTNRSQQNPAMIYVVRPTRNTWRIALVFRSARQ